MSCQANVDPYNNYPATAKGGPPPRPGEATGTFGARIPSYSQPQQQQYLPERNTSMAQRPSPQMMPPPSRPSVQQENEMLRSDLQTAINYIQHLGGTWPPPGH